MQGSFKHTKHSHFVPLSDQITNPYMHTHTITYRVSTARVSADSLQGWWCSWSCHETLAYMKGNPDIPITCCRSQHWVWSVCTGIMAINESVTRLWCMLHICDGCVWGGLHMLYLFTIKDRHLNLTSQAPFKLSFTSKGCPSWGCCLGWKKISSFWKT